MQDLALPLHCAVVARTLLGASAMIRCATGRPAGLLDQELSLLTITAASTHSVYACAYGT
jgi:hypothetical protein